MHQLRRQQDARTPLAARHRTTGHAADRLGRHSGALIAAQRLHRVSALRQRHASGYAARSLVYEPPQPEVAVAAKDCPDVAETRLGDGLDHERDNFGVSDIDLDNQAAGPIDADLGDMDSRSTGTSTSSPPDRAARCVPSISTRYRRADPPSEDCTLTTAIRAMDTSLRPRQPSGQLSCDLMTRGPCSVGRRHYRICR